MDVINFSGGGPQTDPASDALVEAVQERRRRGRRPRDLGRQRPGRLRPRLGRLARHRARRDLGRGPLELARLRARAQPDRADAPAALTRIPFAERGGRAAPAAWATPTSRSSTSARRRRERRARSAQPLRPARQPRRRVPRRSRRVAERRDRARLARHCTFALKATRVKAAGGIGIVLVDNRPGEANGIPIELAVPGGMIADLDGAALRAYLEGHGGRRPVRIGRDPQELHRAQRRSSRASRPAA